MRTTNRLRNRIDFLRTQLPYQLTRLSQGWAVQPSTGTERPSTARRASRRHGHHCSKYNDKKEKYVSSKVILIRSYNAYQWCADTSVAVLFTVTVLCVCVCVVASPATVRAVITEEAMIEQNQLFAREQAVEHEICLNIRFDRSLIISTCRANGRSASTSCVYFIEDGSQTFPRASLMRGQGRQIAKGKETLKCGDC